MNKLTKKFVEPPTFYNFALKILQNMNRLSILFFSLFLPLKLKINKFGCVIGSPVDSEYKNKNNGKCYDQNLAPGILSGDNFTDTYFLLF